MDKTPLVMDKPFTDQLETDTEECKRLVAQSRTLAAQADELNLQIGRNLLKHGINPEQYLVLTRPVRLADGTSIKRGTVFERESKRLVNAAFEPIDATRAEDPSAPVAPANRAARRSKKR